MALDAPIVAYGSLPPSNLAAARQHVQSLSARDREALLRALLEQYEQPPGRSRASQGLSHGSLATAIHSSRSSSSTTTGSISAFPSSLFDCPPLREEAEEDLAVVSATDLHGTSSTSPIDPSRWTAPSPTHSQHLRSQSLSVTTSQPLRGSFSASQLQQAANHGRSRSLSSTSDVPLPLQLPATNVHSKTSTTTATTTTAKPRAKPVLRIKTSTADFQDIEPTSITTAASHSYWCTACGEKHGDRTAWVQHDVTCRGKERRLAREEHDSDSRGRHGDAAGRTCTQRAWACGFCAAFLGSLERYQSHVAGHFERGRTLGHWHFANVIYGLLHQPAVHKPWKRLWAARAAALPAHLRPKATWSPGCCLLGREATDEPTTLQEALEMFDPSHDSASTLALQADALAIYISVPIDEEAQKKPKKHTRTHKSEPTQAKPRVETTKTQTPPPAKETMVQQPERPPSPVTSTTILLPAPKPAAAAPSPPAPNSSIQTKDAPLPALPSYSTLLPPLAHPPSSSLPLDSSKTDVKRGSKLSPRKPLFLFRSKSPSSSPESATDKAVPASTTRETPASQSDRKQSPPTAKLSKPRRAISTPATSASPIPNPNANVSTTTTATTRSTRTTATTTTNTNTNTSVPRRNNWADRPLPPLVRDEFGVLSNRATTATPPIIYTRMAAGFSSDQPPKPPPKPRAYTAADTIGDWNSIATTIVDDIMGPINALHITV